MDLGYIDTCSVRWRGLFGDAHARRPCCCFLPPTQPPSSLSRPTHPSPPSSVPRLDFPFPVRLPIFNPFYPIALEKYDRCIFFHLPAGRFDAPRAPCAASLVHTTVRAIAPLTVSYDAPFSPPSQPPRRDTFACAYRFSNDDAARQRVDPVAHHCSRVPGGACRRVSTSPLIMTCPRKLGPLEHPCMRARASWPYDCSTCFAARVDVKKDVCGGGSISGGRISRSSRSRPGFVRTPFNKRSLECRSGDIDGLLLQLLEVHVYTDVERGMYHVHFQLPPPRPQPHTRPENVPRSLVFTDTGGAARA